jgi:hypothetical protein
LGSAPGLKSFGRGVHYATGLSRPESATARHCTDVAAAGPATKNRSTSVNISTMRLLQLPTPPKRNLRAAEAVAVACVSGS